MEVSTTRAQRQRLDLTDRRFDLLVAKSRLPKLPEVQGERWLCDCDCGRQTIARVKDLTSRNTRSCGCLTNRPRAAPAEPHRAGDRALYGEIRAVVFGVLEAGGTLRGEAVRAQFDSRTSRSSIYRFMRKAALEFALAHPAP